LGELIVTNLSYRPFERSQIEQSISSRFAEQVAQFPNRPAIWTEQYQWTYQELSARVDAMASALLDRLGDGEGRVALIFDHNAPMIAGMLAAMRAGKAYVPLDPGYPEQRLQMMLQDSSPQAILIEAKHRDLANRLCGASLPIIVEGEAHRSALTEFPSSDPRDLAYILYTSGSTGQPKGVMQNHRNVLHFIRAYTNGLLLAPTDRLTLLSSYSFDAAVMGIFGGILNGACVCPWSVRVSGFAELGAWIRKAGISVYHSTPTVFREFLAASDPSGRFSVRRVVLGGEAVLRPDVDRFRQFFEPGTILVNGLGPTESTVTLQHFIDHDTKLTANLVPVGRPVSDTRIVLRDEKGQESEREGEMTFVSEHVALGYWRRSDLNAQSFGESADVPGLRWYRSGDLARWNEDGNLEFLGRKDSQIKIHGVRIELGDIEAALRQQSGVAEAVAVGRTVSGSALPKLIGYVRRSPGAVLDDRKHSEQIRQGVRSLLPSTMVPNIIVFLDAFPKTPTGKIDRLALPEPGEIRSSEASPDDQRYVPPSNQIERDLVKLWQDVLGIEKVSVTDDFRSLGGDSLTALRLLFRMKTLGIPHGAACGIIQGRTIRQIANPEIEIRSDAPIPHEARINLLVNIVRGLLLALVIAGHWITPLTHRFPVLGPWEQPLKAIFNVATPGFAFVFGLTMGKIYYPKYRANAGQTRQMLRSGIWILMAGLVLLAIPWIAAGLSARVVSEWILVHNVLFYYAIALASVPIWFGMIARFESEYVGCAVLMIVFYATYQLLWLWLEPYNQVLVVEMLTAKFNYFNMSFGVIAGCAAGLYLLKNVDDDLSALARRSLILGAALLPLGLFILYLRSGSLRSMTLEDDMGLWRWVFYSGAVLVLGGAQAAMIARIENWPLTLRRGAEVVAIFGQCTLPIFVVHLVTHHSKPVLNMLDVPDLLGLTALLLIFVGFTSWCVVNLYRLHYGQNVPRVSA
jgi:amino acid adenylation domain-containing protein